MGAARVGVMSLWRWGCCSSGNLLSPQPCSRRVRARPPLAAYEGPKARLAVLRFEIRPPTASAVVGDGLADMLAGALLRTNRYLIGGRGPVDLVVLGVVTEFTPAGVTPGEAGQVSMELRLLDAKTSRVLASRPARGRASDTAALGATDQSRLGAGLTACAGTSLEKAIRQAVESGVRVIVAATTTEYLPSACASSRHPLPTSATRAAARAGSSSPCRAARGSRYWKRRPAGTGYVSPTGGKAGWRTRSRLGHPPEPRGLC
jgi:Curli production assembly/transport component CsgG